MSQKKIGICHTKEGPNIDIMYTALQRGFANDPNIKAVHVKKSTELKSNYSMLIMVSYPQTFAFCDEWPQFKHNKGVGQAGSNEFRQATINFAKANKIPLIVIDSGLLNCKRSKTIDKSNFYHICLNSIKNFGDRYYLNSTPQRFNDLGLSLKPWNIQKTNNVLVVGQARFGIATQHIDVHHWYNYVFDYLRSHKKNIIFTPHPNSPNETVPYKYAQIKYVGPGVKLKERLSNVDLAITFSTNAVVEILMLGTPSLCMSKVSIAHDICSNTLEEVNKPKLPAREQWFYDLVNSNWSLKEIEDGRWWAYMKDKIKL